MGGHPCGSVFALIGKDFNRAGLPHDCLPQCGGDVAGRDHQCRLYAPSRASPSSAERDSASMSLLMHPRGDGQEKMLAVANDTLPPSHIPGRCCEKGEIGANGVLKTFIRRHPLEW